MTWILVWHLYGTVSKSQSAVDRHRPFCLPILKKSFFFFRGLFYFVGSLAPWMYARLVSVLVSVLLVAGKYAAIIDKLLFTIIYNSACVACLWCVCVCGGGVSSQLCSPCEYREMLDVLFTLIELCGLMGRLSNVLASVHWATGAQACCGRGHVWQPSHRQRRHARHRNLMAMSMRTSGERHTRL